MDDPARGDPMPDVAYSLVTDPGEAKGSGGENDQDPRQIANPKRIPDKKVDHEKEPAKKKEKKKGEANREVEPGMPRPEVPLNQLDPTLSMNAQDRAWLEPENMVGVRKVRTDYGRYLAISKAMTSYLRGWKMYHGRPSPEFHEEDQKEVPRVTGREVLEVIRGSDTRRFRVQVENKFWGTALVDPEAGKGYSGTL